MVKRLIVLEVESVFVSFAPAQVRFRHRDHIAIFAQQLQVLGFELLWDIEVGTVFYVLIGEQFGGITGIEQTFVSFCFKLF